MAQRSVDGEVIVCVDWKRTKFAGYPANGSSDPQVQPAASVVRLADGQALTAGNIEGVRWDLMADAARGPKVWAALARKMNPQAVERADIMNIGGFSDTVFNLISMFLTDDNQRFVAEVEAMTL